MQYPGLVYVGLFLFPKAASHFSNYDEHNKIVEGIAKVVYVFLHCNSKSGKTQQRPVIDKIVNLFIKNNECFKSLVAVFERGNEHVSSEMFNATNWKHELVLAKLRAIKRALLGVLHLLEYIHNSNDVSKYKHIISYLYNVDTRGHSVLKLVGGYMNHSFDPKIPVIACHILTAFVKVGVYYYFVYFIWYIHFNVRLQRNQCYMQ